MAYGIRAVAERSFVELSPDGAIFGFEQPSQCHRSLGVLWQRIDNLICQIAERPADCLQGRRQVRVSEELQEAIILPLNVRGH